MKDLKFATKALHSGYDPEQNQGAQAVPIFQTSSYVFKDSEQAAKRFALTEAGYIYTRLNNPTNDVLEQRLAAIDGGIGAVVTSSGTAAIVTTLLTILKTGDHIVSSNSLYGGTFNLLNVMLPRFGITTTFVDPSSPENFKKAIRENTKIIYTESLGNPKLDIVDLKKISGIAKSEKLPLVVDNTVAPYLLNPIQHGANIVIYSLTKYVTGNGTSLGGAIIDAGTFDWSSGRFPEFTEPSPAYHGLVYHEALGNAAFIARIRTEGLRDLGSALSPFNSFQTIQGLETLQIRIEKHSKNALALAQWLESREDVAWVNYPGLRSSKYHELANEYLPKGQGGILTFGHKGGYDAAKRIADETKLFALLANIGDTKSLIIHPASTTHSQLTKEEQSQTGVSDDLIRVSVGLEDVEDLIKDLENVFDKLK